MSWNFMSNESFEKLKKMVEIENKVDTLGLRWAPAKLLKLYLCNPVELGKDCEGIDEIESPAVRDMILLLHGVLSE